MKLCMRHADDLDMALELRGLSAPAIVAPGAPPVFDALGFATTQIEMHATHFAGSAAVGLLTGHKSDGGWCPICFVNEALRRDTTNPGLTVDGWVNNAAEEALEASIRRVDGESAPVEVVV